MRAFWPFTSPLGTRYPRLMTPGIYMQTALQLRKRFDIVHIHAAYPLGVVFARALYRLPVRTVLHCHAYDIQVQKEIGYGVRLRPSVNEAIARSIAFYDRIIVTNQNIRDTVVTLGAPREAVSVIYCGVDRSRFEGSIDRSALRRSLGVDAGIPLLISAGRHAPVKGYSFALRAVAELLARGCSCKYVIFGDGVTALLPECQQLGIVENVTLSENISGPALANYLRCADAYVLPSLLEGFPLIKAEAMAAGLPVVTTNVPGCIDFIRHGVNGMVVDRRDPEAFASALQEIITNRNLRERLAQNAFEDSKLLDWERILDQYIEVYRAALETPSSRA